MSRTEQVEAAEVKMNNARDALLCYVESGNTLHQDSYRRLVAQVKKAEAEFLKAVSELE
ncbi:MAG TPA: hypothetical protein VJA94_04395 [Candidatus Angelobacter sp.]